ncbi:Alpha-L-fucosidase [Rhodopirellula sallentina SM41]|uniref:alpha-L-fucosidase n=2 Tax=Rhodopirellula TaxID=265488 RepID=M5UA27_9BACT|nr:Alpha-L-fucosidase [Rhodopirellula sallentina SM41]
MHPASLHAPSPHASSLLQTLRYQSKTQFGFRSTDQHRVFWLVRFTTLFVLLVMLTNSARSEEPVEPIGKYDIWNLPEMPVSPGPYEANWQSLRMYEVPDWFRDGKLGIWSHWDPQSIPERGDWYSRWMYVPGHHQYEHCLQTYGHPSEFGYKDLCALWTCDKWDPEGFVEMAKGAGGKYFVALANHHDNYDCWDSVYQPWNSVNLGPKKDVIGTWAKYARKHGMPFGVTVHASPARTWGQFMPPRYSSDRSGPKKGVPYDVMTATLQSGKGTAWEGLDPKDLYGPPHVKEDDANKSPFANQFMWRVNDLLKYNPELLYFDESAGTTNLDLGVKMGLGYLAPRIAANFYNKSLANNEGRHVAVLNIKEVGGPRDSLETKELSHLVDQSLVKDSEKKNEKEIKAYPFQIDDSLGPWHMNVTKPYNHDARWVIHQLTDIVSKNGNLLLAVPQRAQGNVDDRAREICDNIGDWLSVYGEAIYGTRPFEVYRNEEHKVYFTRKRDHVYAIITQWPKDSSLTLPELRMGCPTIGKISTIELLGSSSELEFTQSNESLAVDLPSESPHEIASVLKISHDKTWINDDDPGVRYRGWTHLVNRGLGEFNNDIYFSNARGDRCSYSFHGSGIDLVTNTNPEFGELMILIDGNLDRVVSLAQGDEIKRQHVVYSNRSLPAGDHVVEIVNVSNRRCEMDALVITP